MSGQGQASYALAGPSKNTKDPRDEEIRMLRLAVDAALDMADEKDIIIEQLTATNRRLRAGGSDFPRADAPTEPASELERESDVPSSVAPSLGLRVGDGHTFSGGGSRQNVQAAFEWRAQ